MISTQAGCKNGVYITKKLMAALNLKDYQAVGFAGCWMEESHCDPAAYNKEEKAGKFKGSSTNGPGYGAGLGLWSNSWKTSILKQFNNYSPIETWTMDLLIAIVIKGCTESYLNLLRGCSDAAQATDIVLRGYENGSGGRGTKLRSKESMKAYTWCKKSYVADSGYQTFSDGYVGALTSRASWAKKILKMMGNFTAADLANIGNIAGSAEGDYGMGGGISLSQADIQKLIEQYQNAYPVHSEYETYSGSGGNIFTNSSTNAFSMASLSSEKNQLDTYTNSKSDKIKRTRIYSTNDSTIILDELKLPLDTSTDDHWANQYVTQKDVDKWQKDMDKLQEEAKKKKAEEDAKKALDSSLNQQGDISSSDISSSETSDEKKSIFKRIAENAKSGGKNNGKNKDKKTSTTQPSSKTKSFLQQSIDNATTVKNYTWGGLAGLGKK